MFEEFFTEDAKKVMQLANKEARCLNHEYIGTEHILLGLVKESGEKIKSRVYKILSKHGLNYKKIESEVKKIVRPGLEPVTTVGKLPVSPRGKKVIEYAIEEARSLNCPLVEPEHLLMGLFRESEGIAYQVLAGCGVKLEDVRAQIPHKKRRKTTPTTKKRKKERPVKCKIFKVKETISPGVELVGGEFDSIVRDIEKFLHDGKELVEATQSQVVYGHNIITKITIFYRDK